MSQYGGPPLNSMSKPPRLARVRGCIGSILTSLADVCLWLADTIDPSRRERVLAQILARLERESLKAAAPARP